MRRLLNNFLYGKVNASFYDNNRMALDNTNFRVVAVLYCCAIIYSLTLNLFSFQISSLKEIRSVFAFLTILSACGALLIVFYIRREKKYVRLAYYVVTLILYTDSIFIVLFNPVSDYASIYYVLLIVLPVLFVDKPINSMVYALIMTVIFNTLLSMQYSNNTEIILYERINSVSILIIELFFIWYIRNLHICSLQGKITFKKQSQIDALTGIYNKVQAEKMCEKYIAEDSNNKCSLIVLDIDNFKLINDTYGHLIGDEVLRLLGEILRNLFKDQDVVGRIGGDEFIILVQETCISELSEKSEKLLKETKKIGEKVGIGPISCSVGICVKNEGGITYQDMFIRADQTLYKAKKNGKGVAEYYK